MLANFAQIDVLTKLLIEKGIITDAEFKQKLLEERAVYQRISESDNAVIVPEKRRQPHVSTQVAFHREHMAKY